MTPTPAKHSVPKAAQRRGLRRTLRWSGVGLGVVVAASAWALSACSVGPKATEAELAKIERGAIETTLADGTPVTLVYRRAGPTEARRLIFIHGTPGDSGAWADELVDPLPGFEVVAVDRLGLGRSQPARVFTSYHDQAAAIAPLLVTRDGKAPIIVGHSLGGPIAATICAWHPERVGGLLILAGSFDPAMEVPRWYNHAASWGVFSWMLPEVMLKSNKEMFAGRDETTHLIPKLASITCPVIIMQGEKDTLVPPSNATYVKDRLTSARSVGIEMLPNEGHFLPWKQRARMRELIQRLNGAR
jgi:pimeloyl-ACP methyl ester carboxylesterase